MILLQQGGLINNIMSFLPFILIFVVMYFFMMRPQMKKQKQEKNFQNSISKGQRVVTNTGIHGKISEITDDGIILETMAGKIKFEKNSISRELSVLRYPENKDEK